MPDQDEGIEPEIERLLTIPRLDIKPKEAWRGYIKSEDIAELSTATPMDQKHWLFSSMLEQAIDDILIHVKQHNRYLRQLEAGQIRARLALEREAEQDLGIRNMWKFIRWFSLIAGGAVIVFFARKWLPQLFP